MRIVATQINTVKHPFSARRLMVIVGLLITIILLTIVVPRFATHLAAARNIAPASTATPQEQGCCSNVPGTLRRMIGTYYTTENNFQSTLILNNKGPNEIAVTPILHSQTGQTFNAAPVTVTGQSSLEVPLNALAAIAGSQFRSGSFEFTYTGRIMEMGGGLRISDPSRSLMFDEQLLEAGMKFSSPQLEAVYAIPFDSARVSVILTNTTAQSLTVSGDAILAGINGHHPINSLLNAHETRVINLPPGLVRQAAAGAVSLNHNGVPGALLAMIHVEEAGRGYSAAVNFNDLAQSKTTEWHGVGLRLGNVSGDLLKPVIVVRNNGSNASTVTARIPFSRQDGSTGAIALPQVSLVPGEIRLLDTSNPQLLLPDYATAGLELEYTSAPGNVIAAASSISVSGTQVFALPLKDPQGGMSSTGGYPWFINGTSSTVVFVKNTTDEAQKFYLDIVYAGGMWGSNLRTIAPGQTLAFDVRKIRNEQEVGSEGNTLPPDVTTGHIAWSLYRTCLQFNKNRV